MNIKSQKDFYSGLLFLIIGAAFAIGAYQYSMGSGARMGPGYFPRMLGILLAALGAFIIFEAMTIKTKDGEKIGAWAWKPLVFIVGANLSFGVLLGGLPSIGLPAAGLVFAIVVLIAIASMAEETNRVSDIWLGSAIGLVLGALVVGVIARYLVILLEPGPYLALRVAAESPNLLKALIYFSQVGGRILSFLLVAYLFHKYVPLGKGTKEYALLAMTLIALSVWSFVSLLGLQFQVWPAFITG